MAIELICSVRTPCMLQAAIGAGADAITCGLRGDTSIRNYPGQKFSPREMASCIQVAHDRGVKVYVAIDTFARAGATSLWKNAISFAKTAGADAVVLADLGMLEYASCEHPELCLHSTMPIAAATPEVMSFYLRTFGVTRFVMPLLNFGRDTSALPRSDTMETEAHIFGESRLPADSHRSMDIRSVLPKSEQPLKYSPLDLEEYSATLPADRKPFQPLRPRGAMRDQVVPLHARYPSRRMTPRMLVTRLNKAGATGLNIDAHHATRGSLSEMIGAFRKAIDTVNAR